MPFAVFNRFDINYFLQDPQLMRFIDAIQLNFIVLASTLKLTAKFDGGIVELAVAVDADKETASATALYYGAG